MGHQAGDELLGIVTRRFVNQLGDRARVARIGGDEFAVVCVGRTSDELVGIGQELVDVLSAPVALDGLRIGVTASIGVAVSPDDGCTGLELLRSADVAMYAAKRSNVFVCAYDRRSDANDRDQIALVQELRTAIDQQQLVLHFQPTLDCSTMTIRGVEALVRWPHPTRGLLYPDSFIPLAEQVELMSLLTRSVLELAIAEARRFRDLGQDLQMSVNVSRHDLVDDTLGEHIDTLLRQHDVAHDKLTLEVTEACFSMDSERVSRNINELRARGIRISIDDFGVGYSSMSQLLGLPIDELKIDKTFVLALLTDGRAESIVRSTIQLGRALNLRVVAEGVETSEVLVLLRELGVDVAQGYWISRPLARDQLLHYLEGLGAWPAPCAADRISFV
jgi:predicted signal transduction protein with EAL and GGDEF domain